MPPKPLPTTMRAGARLAGDTAQTESNTGCKGDGRGWRATHRYLGGQACVRCGELKPARRILDEAQLEEAFMQQIIDLAKLRGWLHYHTRDSQGSAPGFPDLVLARRHKGFQTPVPGSARIIFAELKSEKGKVSPEQETWLAILRISDDVEVYVWRPSDWDKIEEVLR